VTTRVLLLEDEYDTRDLLTRALARAGYEVSAAADQSEALGLLSNDAGVEIIVSDLMIGADDRNGLRFLTELRARGVRAPVIVITAFADVEKVKIALNEGAAYLLEKPFRAPELIDAIERTLLRETGSPGADTVFDRANLTEKERIVGRHLLAGLSSEEIAMLENNSAKTIRQHITQIYAKCGVGSRAEFFRFMFAR
jgi:DNA-binding NarL/FixJ family response regulator